MSLRWLLGRTPLYGGFKRLGHHPDYWYWKLRGEPIRSPHLLKQRTVRRFAQLHGLRILIETGTYYGEMVRAVRSQFDRIYSIESDAVLAARARRIFARWPHIRICEGDSGTLVPELLEGLTQAALFWLDAGYYGWGDAPGEPSRLAKELDAILRHPVPGHVILLDDARGLDGVNGPSLEDIREGIARDFPNRSVSVEHDIVRVT